MMKNAQHFVSWMKRDVLPLFLQQGIKTLPDGAACFRETLPDDSSLRRSRVQTRQLYVYAHATRTGWLDARKTLDVVPKLGLKHFTSSQGVFMFSDGDTHLDQQTNAYEQAFALLAYSELYALTGDATFHQLATQLHDWMQANLALAEGGYAINTRRPAMLSQNPNMHLFEAMLSWWHHTGEARWEQEAHRLFNLFIGHLFHRDWHCLVEFFSPGWLADHPQSSHVDPGHHHEWTWLLYEYQKISGVNTTFWREALQHFATQAGENPRTQAVMNEVYHDQTRYRAGSRLWCQTERLKSDVVACQTLQKRTAFSTLDQHASLMMHAVYQR
jgi:mannose-6-phosphate isomerase